MCQNVYYTYACSHVQMTTWSCSAHNTPDNGYCAIKERAGHVKLDSELCHDCEEKARKERAEQRRLEYLQKRLAQARARADAEANADDDTEVETEGQSEQEQRESLGNGQPLTGTAFILSRDPKPIPAIKRIRALETNKLENMDCSFEGRWGVKPSTIYRIYAARSYI
ncbi:hypothetical protein C8035_v011373 [Colletotrichum spinosum]|uniref:Uncharacterized protein n=1 Tax=Colletotrichum spinosum TaxID=1347390 RepID=A0A4R8Q2Q5_9PEZI|nr:hypothetical protein C8035_v011373 [Colletotrichum spinosum]